MRRLRYLTSIVFIGILLGNAGCGKDKAPEISPEDQQLTKLSKTWKCTAATLGSSPQTGYTNFQLVINGTPGSGSTGIGYTTSGRPVGTKSSPWPSSGTFKFGNDFATQLTRDDLLPITYSVSDTQLQMTFVYSGTGFDGRTDVVAGNWVYTFQP
jgi:hypothetical protein